MGCAIGRDEKGKAVMFVCSPTPMDEKKKFFRCFKCKKKRIHLIKYYEWYGPSGHCLTCKNRIAFE